MIIWNPGISLEDNEKNIVIAAMKFYGNEDRAANSLKITVKELQKMIKKYQEDFNKIQEIKENEKNRLDEFVKRSRGIMPSI